jgi:hypothetical protein
MRARILKLAGGAVIGLIALDLIATAATLTFGWGFMSR